MVSQSAHGHGRNDLWKFLSLSADHLGLARYYRLRGDIAKAHAAYRDFFALWKNADPDIFILNAAKSEYARVQWLDCAWLDCALT
ncbi:MAG: hypothetical protein WCA91_10565 [Candidatus Acidiferrales bacterium]